MHVLRNRLRRAEAAAARALVFRTGTPAKPGPPRFVEDFIELSLDVPLVDLRPGVAPIEHLVLLVASRVGHRVPPQSIWMPEADWKRLRSLVHALALLAGVEAVAMTDFDRHGPRPDHALAPGRLLVAPRGEAWNKLGQGQGQL